MFVKTQQGAVPVYASDQFATTRWSVVLHAYDSGGPGENKALAELCRTYWRPIFAFICRRGYSAADAQDLTQDFFLMIVKSNLLKLADPHRGRFRALLLTAVKNFLLDATEKRHAQKRGSQFSFVSWDDWMAEAPSHGSISGRLLEHLSPERLFDLGWATTVVERALQQLSAECESRGRRRLFDLVSNYLTAERSEISYRPIAKKLGVDSAEVKRLLFQMRRRYRELLRAEVAKTVERPEDIDAEIRYLCLTLAAA